MHELITSGSRCTTGVHTNCSLSDNVIVCMNWLLVDQDVYTPTARLATTFVIVCWFFCVSTVQSGSAISCCTATTMACHVHITLHNYCISSNTVTGANNPTSTRRTNHTASVHCSTLLPPSKILTLNMAFSNAPSKQCATLSSHSHFAPIFVLSLFLRLVGV